MTSKHIYLSMHGAYLFTPSSEAFDHGPGQAHGKGGLGATVRSGHGIARAVWSHGVGMEVRIDVKGRDEWSGDGEREREKTMEGKKSGGGFAIDKPQRGVCAVLIGPEGAGASGRRWCRRCRRYVLRDRGTRMHPGIPGRYTWGYPSSPGKRR